MPGSKAIKEIRDYKDSKVIKGSLVSKAIRVLKVFRASKEIKGIRDCKG